MTVFSHIPRVQRLQIVVIAFLALAALSLFVVYVADPSIYAQSLSLVSPPVDRYPFPVTLFLVGIVAFLALLIFGVLCQWRWIFWLMLIAFSCSLLQVPVILFQLAGILPNAGPLWYSLFRMGVAMAEGGIAVWMIQIYRHEGVWAMRRKKHKRSLNEEKTQGRFFTRKF